MPNEPLQLMKFIPLTKGYYAKVDDSEPCASHKWLAMTPNGKAVYAARKTNAKIVLLHREIMGIKDPRIIVDHKDGDTLNNCKSNLRVCDYLRNNWNKRMNKRNKSGYKGVSFSKGNNKWRSQIQVRDKFHHIGYFKDKIEAAKAYDEAATELYGEFAWLNFPNNIETLSTFA